MKRTLPTTWLVGKKTRLRPLETADVPLLARFGLPLHSRGVVFIVQTLAGRDIGALGFLLRGRHAAVGLNLPSKKAWSDGTAADALRTIRDGVYRASPIVRLEALVPVDRKPMLAAYRRAGFVREGVLRDALAVRDAFKDAAILSVIDRG